MGLLTAAQRNVLYLQEAERVGIHKPLLAALHQVHNSPSLQDGETGLGISPTNRIALEQVDTFAKQVKYAASTVRSLVDSLIAEGWKPANFWDSEKGCYSEKFIQAIANGFTAPASKPTAALLESSDANLLMEAYLADFKADSEAEHAPLAQDYLDQALKTFVEEVPRYYQGLPHQRDGLVEAIQIWRGFDTREATLAALGDSATNPSKAFEFYPDLALLQFAQHAAQHYDDYPHQQEALIRLTQLWRQLNSRDAAIASLAKSTTAADLKVIDSALIALIHRIPQLYEGKGSQRNALVEGFRLWKQQESRSTALVTLGINPDIFSTANPEQNDLKNAAAQLDRALLDFVRRIPSTYERVEYQREALIRLTQLWRGVAAREQTLQSLAEDLKRMENAQRGSLEAPPAPTPIAFPNRPGDWTPHNIQLFASIIPNGSFTWIEATHGGTQMPPNQAAVDAIVRVAELIQQARDRIGRPFHVINWYSPSDNGSAIGGVLNRRHTIGDAINFYCNGLTSDQLYWFLDPWWTGGLGRFSSYPYLIHVDARGYRVRWLK